jgi:hypothetical protein
MQKLREWNGYDAYIHPHSYSARAIGALSIAGYIGIFFYRNWARILLTVLLAINVIFSPLVGVVVLLPLESLLATLIGVALPVIVILAFFSDINKRFKPVSNKLWLRIGLIIFLIATLNIAFLIRIHRPALPNNKVMEIYIRDNFPEPEWRKDLPENQRNYNSTFFVRSSKIGPFLREHRIFETCCEFRRLEYFMLPSGISCGLFVTDGKKIQYLFGDRRKVLADIFKTESIQLQKMDSMAVAEFLSEVLLTNRNASASILHSKDDIFKMTDAKYKKVGLDYVLNESERYKYEDQIAPPRVTGNSKAGWSIEFYTLFGWMHETQTVSHHTVNVSPNYEITDDKEVLSDRVFSKLPNILY